MRYEHYINKYITINNNYYYCELIKQQQHGLAFIHSFIQTVRATIKEKEIECWIFCEYYNKIILITSCEVYNGTQFFRFGRDCG